MNDKPDSPREARIVAIRKYGNRARAHLEPPRGIAHTAYIGPPEDGTEDMLRDMFGDDVLPPRIDDES